MAAPPNSVDRQILDLRDLFTQLEQRYVALVANFQMLRPLLDNDLLKERMDDPSKRLGAVAIATALFNACVLDACAMLRMPRPKERLKIGQYPNLALADAIKPFLPKNRTKNGALIDQLSKERLNRAAHSPSQYSETMPSDFVQRFIEDDDRKRDASLCEFQDDLEALLKDSRTIANCPNSIRRLPIPVTNGLPTSMFAGTQQRRVWSCRTWRILKTSLQRWKALSQ